jgi:hypothetical protein
MCFPLLTNEQRKDETVGEMNHCPAGINKYLVMLFVVRQISPFGLDISIDTHAAAALATQSEKPHCALQQRPETQTHRIPNMATPKLSSSISGETLCLHVIVAFLTIVYLPEAF